MIKSNKHLNNHKYILLTIIMIFILLILQPAITGAVVNEGDELYFTILHTNDEHSALIPWNPAVDYHPEKDSRTLGGFARLATLIETVKGEKHEEKEPVVLVSAGDYMGGTIFGWLVPAGYGAEINLMQKIGYDMVIIGNHEFDYGPEVLASYYKKAGYPDANERTALVSSNIRPPEGHPLKDIKIKKTYIKELDNGLKIGFFGLLGNFASTEAPFFEPMQLADPFETAMECVKELKEQGADVIVAVTHSGIREDQELVRKVPGIHVIVGGHDHYEFLEPVMEENTIIVQAGNFVKYLGLLELAFSPTTNEVRFRNHENNTPFLIPVEHPTSAEPYIDKEVQKYVTEMNSLINKYTDGRFKNIMDTVVYSTFPLHASRTEMREMEMGNFITDAMRIVGEKHLGQKVDFAFQGTGVIRSAVSQGSYHHSMDKISVYDLLNSIPLGMGADDVPGYPLAAAYLNGKDIYKILEISSLLSEYMGYEYFLQVSGLRYQFDRDRTILFWIPWLDLPIPSTSSVLNAELYTSDGMQTDNDNDYQLINKTTDELYLVVTDYAILTAIPLIAEKIPWLEIVPRNAEGEPVKDYSELKMVSDGEELKVWQAVLDYATNQPMKDDNPWVDEYYRDFGGRIQDVKGPSIFIWPIITMVIFIVIIALCIRLIRRRRKKTFVSDPSS